MITRTALMLLLAAAWPLCRPDAKADPPPASSDKAPATDAPGSTPETAASPPTTADEWLEHIEKRLAGLQTIHADLVYDRIDAFDTPFEEKQTHHGRFIFHNAAPVDEKPEPKDDDANAPKPPEPLLPAKRPARFAAHFHKLVIGRRPRPMDQWYVFDGRWLVEKSNDEKLFIKHEVAGRDKDPNAADPLSSGEGPFFFPITARKAQIVKQFDVTIIEPAEKDPPQTVHLRLTPKPNRRTTVTQLDLWYDTKTSVPVRVETLDTGPNKNIIIIKQLKIDELINPKVFDTTEPKGRGWRVEVKPLKKAAD